MAEELTLESLARRIERIEEQLRNLRGIAPTKDWRRVVGIADDSEVMPLIVEAGQAIRKADREAKRDSP